MFNAPKAVVLTCAVLLAIHVARMLLPQEMDTEVYLRLALIPGFLDSGLPYYWTLFTYALLHADLAHVVINTAFILAIGTAVARLTSGRMFLALFVLSALGGGVAIYLFSDPQVPTVGASGGLNGLIGAAAVLFYRYRDTDPRAKMMGVMVVIVVVMNVFLAVTGGSSVSWIGHLGGLAAGLIYGYAALSRST